MNATTPKSTRLLFTCLQKQEIRAYKRKHNRLEQKEIAECVEKESGRYKKDHLYKVNQLEAMHWVEEAWHNELSSSTIRNCFWKTRILRELSEKAKTMRENENNAQLAEVEMLMKTDAELIYGYPMAAISVEIESLEKRCAVHPYLTDKEITKMVDKFEFPEEEADLPIVPDLSIVEKLDRTNKFLEML
ncbi:hypothetical protein DFQ30_001992 [Apophysomyces sp. BC1015]|nr:hypothetical protein DFQ30_001992 [Apophysomyces sp. BC1015]